MVCMKNGNRFFYTSTEIRDLNVLKSTKSVAPGKGASTMPQAEGEPEKGTDCTCRS